MNSLLLLHQSSSFLVPFTSKTQKQPIPFRLQPICSRRVIDSNKDDFKAINSTASDKQLPVVRTYENDLCSLSLVGSVDFEQALTAAAADGGETADEHLASNLETMVVETVSPGDYDDRSTVSTRLFLPVDKVKEKSTKLRSSLAADILSSSSVPKNILAMTFRQVVLQHLWSFKLSIFSSGTERDMEHLADTREIQIKFCISSSNILFLSKLSEVVCSWTLKNTKMSYLKNISASSSHGIFDWPKKFLGMSTGDSSIRICRLSQSEIKNGAKKHFEKFVLAKRKSYFSKQHRHNLLEPPNFSLLEKVAGVGFGEWAKEFVPAYKLQVDGNLFKDIKLEGLQEMPNNRWEALLTHAQMDKLLHILDMYYEDRYTLPAKELSCGLAVETSITIKKFMWKLFIGSIAGVCFLIITAVFAQIYWPYFLNTRKVSDQNSTLPLIEPYTSRSKSLNTAEVKPLCVSVIQKIKDELGLPGDIMVDEKCGAWTGILPSYLKELISCAWEQIEDSSSVDSLANDIASYQVVMSGDGTIVGFQPTSRVAVNHWASNPLAKVLYGGRKISPGIIEPGLKIPHPDEIAVIEVLMSANTKPSFILARPMQ